MAIHEHKGEYVLMKKNPANTEDEGNIMNIMKKWDTYTIIDDEEPKLMLIRHGCAETDGETIEVGLVKIHDLIDLAQQKKAEEMLSC